MLTAFEIVSLAAGLGGLWVGFHLASSYESSRRGKGRRMADYTIITLLLLGPGFLAYAGAFYLLMLAG